MSNKPATVAVCAECGTNQFVVTGTGVLRLHDRIDLATGANLGKCPGSGAEPVQPHAAASQPSGRRRVDAQPRHIRCGVCRQQVMVGPTGVLARHRKSTGAQCPASRKPPDWLTSQGKQARVGWRCLVCGQATRRHIATNKLNDHTWPNTDILCVASGKSKSWLPATKADGLPTRRLGSSESVPVTEARRLAPKMTRESKAKAAELAKRKRKKAAQQRDANSPAANNIRVFLGGAPGLGRRR
jgi:hypothetical protein